MMATRKISLGIGPGAYTACRQRHPRYSVYGQQLGQKPPYQHQLNHGDIFQPHYLIGQAIRVSLRFEFNRPCAFTGAGSQ
jgi:hypothetical protein